MGAQTEVWVNAFTAYGSWEISGGTEDEASQKRQSFIRAKSVIPYRDGLVGETDKYRISHGGRIWNILMAEDLTGRKAEITIEASVVT